MQNLLTCPEADFDAYFNEYDNLRDEIDLRDRLRSIRRGKIVTASRYATGDITSAQKLIFAVFESLSLALQEGGYKFDGAKTLRGKIATWRIKIIICFARNEEEQNTIRALIINAVRNTRYHRLIFVDASSNLMSDKTFNRWLENSAHEKYWRENNPETANE